MLGADLQEGEQVFRAVCGRGGVKLQVGGPEVFSAQVSSASGQGSGLEAHLVVRVPAWARTHPLLQTPWFLSAVGCVCFLWSAAQVLPATWREFEETG